MTRFTTQVAGFVLMVCLAGCGGEPPSLVGVWKHQVHQDMLLEFREDGSYTSLFDCGNYSVGEDNALNFTGSYWRGSTVYDFVDQDLQLTRTVMPGAPPDVGVWSRVHMPPNIDTTEVNGETVPSGIPSLVTFSLATIAIPWQEDAIPISVDAEKGLYDECERMEVEIRFHSPKTGKGLDVSVRPYKITHREFTIRTRQNAPPLPIGFIDVPEVVKIGRDLGFKGPYKEVMLNHWRDSGFIWSTRSRYSLDAMNGRQITNDYTGYVEAYNQDWANATKLLVEAFGNNLDKEGCPILVRNGNEALAAMLCANKRDVERRKSECRWSKDCEVIGDTVHWKDGGVHP